MRNLEIKTRVDDISLIEKIAVEIGAELKDDFVQVDTYFNVSNGRLKLREFEDGKAELIFYQRLETSDERWSDYEIAPVCEPNKLKDLLGKIFGIKVVVKKRRKVYIYKNARIHIDRVDKLDDFLEFEVIYNGDGEQVKDLMRFLVDKFNLKRESLIRTSYSDLLIQKQNKI